MKALNTMKFVSNTIEDLSRYKYKIESSESYEKAKEAARQMLGYIDCMITFNNTMICSENNDFTGDFCEVLDEWIVHVYQALINKAIETNQDHELILKLLKKRDEVAGM